MPFENRHETIEDIENNYYHEGHYVMPPGIMSPGKALRLENARQRDSDLTMMERYRRMLDYEQRSKPLVMEFSMDLNNEYDLETIMEICKSNLERLKTNPISKPF